MNGGDKYSSRRFMQTIQNRLVLILKGEGSNDLTVQLLVLLAKI
jgi:hypothetical protein